MTHPASALAVVLLLGSASPASSSPTGSWSAIEYPAPPAARAMSVAFDAASRRLYRFGGTDGSRFDDHTWVLDLNVTPAEWNRVRVAGDVPSQREHHALVTDPARGRLLLYGGVAPDGRALGDLWALSLAGEPHWTRLEVPGVAPRARWAHAALLDPVRDRLVVSGGQDGSGTLGDAWALALAAPAWTPLAPGTAGPEPRHGAALAYDGTNDVAWIFGGRDHAGLGLPELWRFGPGDSAGCLPIVLTGEAPDVFTGHSMVFDPGRARLLVFGGQGAAGPSDRAYSIWTVDRSSTLLAPAGAPPTPRSGQACVFDARMDRLYLIGGWDGAPLGDVRWMDGDGRSWNLVEPTGAGPGPLAWHSAVLDDSLRRILVWGGRGEGGLASGLWSLSLTDAPAWTALPTTGDAPPARLGHVAGFDPAARRMTIAGGTTGGLGALGDAWWLDVDSLAWHAVPRTEPALARRAAAGGWDTDRARLLLFGGLDSGSTVPAGDLRTLARDSSAWAQAWPLPGQPGPRSGHTLVHHTVEDALVMFGGRDGDTRLGDLWRLALAGGTWAPLAAAGTPPEPRDGHVAVYDQDYQRMLMFGGDTGPARVADAWSLTLGPAPEWSAVAAGDGPAPRARHGAALDRSGGRLVVLGGADGDTLREDAWALAYNTGSPAWSALVPATCRPPRQTMPTVTLDPLRRRLIVLGNSGAVAQRAWVMPLDGVPEWHPLEAEGEPPPARWGHTAVYDASRDRIVYFGGSWWVTVTTMNDVWALNLSPVPRWEQLFPTGTPPEPRLGHAAVYDPVRDQMVVQGGVAEAGQLWAFPGQWALRFADSLRWERVVTTDGSQCDRNYHTLTYDPVRDRILAFGGCELDTYGSMYALTFGDSVKWTKLLWANTGGPANRRSHSAVYDPLHDRVIVYGGDSDRFWAPPGAPHFGDVWAIELADSLHCELIDMGTGPGPGTRCEHNAVWDPLFGRMLMFGGNDGGPDLNDLWQATWEGAPPAAVEPPAPAGAALAIRSVRPNPVSGRAVVSLALPGEGPATLDVFDLQGRRLLRREVPAAGAATARIELDARGALAPGVYLLRLTQGGRTAVGRMAVIR